MATHGARNVLSHRKFGSIHFAGILCALVIIGGCGLEQSTLNPAGRGAKQIADLFWYMTAGAAVIWLIVVGLFVYAIHYCPLPHNDRRSRLTVIGGGVVVPTIVLTGLLAYGLALLPELQAPAKEGSLVIDVEGIQYWWRVRYANPDNLSSTGAGSNSLRSNDWFTETANEIVLPVGQEVEFRLRGQDVIHSFWIPSIGGKVDMMPGRVNRLKLAPTRVGRYRGVCAEYCGESHAMMAFDVRVVEPDEFDAWLARQSESASTPTEEVASLGARRFLAVGCGACHTIRGTEANGSFGPDLTHVGSRATIGAATLANDHAKLADWTRRPDAVKPGVLMPSFDHLSDEDIEAITIYLKGLQ